MHTTWLHNRTIGQDTQCPASRAFPDTPTHADRAHRFGAPAEIKTTGMDHKFPPSTQSGCFLGYDNDYHYKLLTRSKRGLEISVRRDVDIDDKHRFFSPPAVNATSASDMTATQALSSEDAPFWRDAMQREMEQMDAYEV
ncbi:hypothetical protein BROUX41_005810 [Berkeleyomyces rouxiae]|uniref:uncharacterized protein n=1 Tax=Berkeleyomyces rouxiae TaxID=2035830 RepID=UPI003B76D26B